MLRLLLAAPLPVSLRRNCYYCCSCTTLHNNCCCCCCCRSCYGAPTVVESTKVPGEVVALTRCRGLQLSSLFLGQGESHPRVSVEMREGVRLSQQGLFVSSGSGYLTETCSLSVRFSNRSFLLVDLPSVRVWLPFYGSFPKPVLHSSGLLLLFQGWPLQSAVISGLFFPIPKINPDPRKNHCRGK